MKLSNLPKLVLMVVLVVAIVALMITGTMDTAAGTPMLTTILGYAVRDAEVSTNGHGSKPVLLSTSVADPGK